MNINLPSVNMSNTRYARKRRSWTDLCIDLLFFANIVAYFLTQFIGGSFKYVAICSAFIILVIFGYKSKKKKLDYSLFTETMPLLVHLFGFFILLSSGWSVNRASTLHMFVAYETGAVLFSLFYVHYRETADAIERIQNVLVCSGLCIAIVIVAYLGVDELRRLTESGSRMRISDEYDVKLFNINNFAFILLATSLVLFVSLLHKGLSLLTFSVVPMVLLICLTGCRKALIGLLLVSFFVMFISFLKQRKVRKLFWVFITLIAVSFLLAQLFDSQFMELFRIRTEETVNGTSGSDDLRLAMVKLGWKIFQANPLVGCGIDGPRFINERELNYFAYLHNNMAELLAGGGILGFVLYYSRFFLLVKPVLKTLSERNVEGNDLQRLCLSVGLLVVLLIYDVGAVTYYNFGILYFSMPLYVLYGNYSNQFSRR